MNKKSLKKALSSKIPKGQEDEQYAVALLIDFSQSVPKVTFIERARADGDHWSGDIAFPGGKKEKTDKDLLDTAIRESQEEIGVHAKRDQHWLGYHKKIGLKKRGLSVPGDLHSFVFTWDKDFQVSRSLEVESFFQLDCNYLCDLNNLGSKKIIRDNLSIEVPGIKINDHIIWGLTYSILVDLLKKLNPNIKLPVY